MHGHALAAGAAPATLSSPAAARGLPLFGLALLAGLLCVCERLLQDPDTQWHIAVGRAIWDSGRVPRTDPFSHTFAGAPWIAKEWLSQLLLFAAHATAGWRGVAVLACVAIAVSFTLLLGFLQGRIDPTRALMATLVAILLSAGQLLARPHVLTLPILVVWTGCLMRVVERRAPPPWGLLWLMAMWANLHAGFAIGFAVAGLLAAEAVLAGGPAGRAGRAARWGLFLAGALAASCASPYGWRPLAVGAALLGSGEPLPYIGEWQPLGLDPTGVAAVGALLLLLAALGLRPRRNLFRLLIVALFGAMMIRHVRFLVLFALVAPIVAAGPLAAAFPRLAPRAGPRPSSAGRSLPGAPPSSGWRCWRSLSRRCRRRSRAARSRRPRPCAPRATRGLPGQSTTTTTSAGTSSPRACRRSSTGGPTSCSSAASST